MAAAPHHEQRLIDFMAEACHDQIFLFTDCCCFNARGQGREISQTKSLFTVDLTEGSFLEQDSGLSHYKPTQKIMTCRCSAVGRKLVFLVFPFSFPVLLIYSKAALVSSSAPPHILRSRLPHCYITGNICSFLSRTFSHLPFVRRNNITAIIVIFL